MGPTLFVTKIIATTVATDQVDDHTPTRYNRRDTPARLYRDLRFHDRMRPKGHNGPAGGRRIGVSGALNREQVMPRRRSESRQRTALVAVRLLPRERDILAETARSRGVSLSEFIRSSAMLTASAPEAGSNQSS
jgi:hypothetical protein